METVSIDIKGQDFDLYVDGQLVLHVGQVSDDETVNLFFYPKGGDIIESVVHQFDDTAKCTHELLAERKKGDILRAKLEEVS